MSLLGHFWKKTDTAEEPLQAPPEEDVPEEYWRAVGISRTATGAEECLLHRPDGFSLDVSTHEAGLLTFCGQFSTLAEHAARMAHGLGHNQRQAMELLATLDGWAKAGLFFPLSRLLEGRGPAQARAEVTSVAVVTCDRVETARRCLASFMDNARRHGRRPEWLLFDDSEDPRVRSDYRAMLSTIGPDAPGGLAYCGNEEKRNFATHLEALGLPRSVVEFCLFGDLKPTYGCPTNARLLDLYGKAGLQVDDDVVCKVAATPGGGGVRLASGDPTSFRFFRDRTQALAALAEDEDDQDWIGLHEGMLGRTFPDLCALHGGPGPEDLAAATDRLLLAADSPSGRVAVTSAGLGGDAAMGSPFYYFLLEGASEERLLERPEALDDLLQGRAVQRSVDAPTVGDGSWFMTYAVGFDHRRMLPPFFPVLRGHDDLFGKTLKAVFPDRLLGHLPWVVAHDPPGVRREAPGTILPGFSGLPFLEVVQLLTLQVGATLPGGLEDAERFRSLGRRLGEAGSLPPGALHELIRPLALGQAGARLAGIEAALDRNGSRMGLWAGRLDSWLEASRKALAGPGWPVLPDLRSGRTEIESLALAASLLRAYGALLEHWPDLLEASRRLSERGIRLVRPVK